MSKNSTLSKGEDDDMEWHKRAHKTPAQNKIENYKELVEDEIFRKKSGVAATREALKAKGLMISENTLRSFIKKELKELGSIPENIRRGKARLKLESKREKIEKAVFNSDLRYLDILRGLKSEGVQVSLGSLITYIRLEFYQDREIPKRFQ